uniref:Plasma membrane-associated cation-binding protein 1 n=1 Tax=Tanacetum cinerariifolium TaxID=118510 RepID=A0A6L2K6Z3_TANCI|nr:plasma membrane-associated cation-binding protein 1 [Tanacetum cinerariifolium]
MARKRPRRDSERKAPTIRRSNTKKIDAAEACKTFDDAKEGYTKEVDEKKTKLQTKVVKVYEASATEIKGLVKEPTDASLKKNAKGVISFLEELLKIGFGEANRERLMR